MNLITEEMEQIGADGVDFCSIAWRYFLSINKPFPIYKSFTKKNCLSRMVIQKVVELIGK